MARDARVSVALCTYQGEAHLLVQLASLLEQTEAPDEVVVGDDGSTDATMELLRAFADRAPFPVRVTVRERLGPSANFAATIAQCTGDLVALCDQDDRWHPRRLASARSALADHPSAAAAFSDAALIGPDGRALRRSLWGSIGVDQRERRRLDADPLAALLRRPMVTGCTMTFRRSLLDLAAPFPTDAGLQHDRWLALCAATVGPLVAIDEELVDYRVHGAQHTGLGPLSTASGRPRGRLHPSRARRMRRTGDERLAPALDQTEVLMRRLHDAGRHVPPQLERHRALLTMRSGLPLARLRRVVPVVRHLLRGDYHRCATGAVGAAADLLRR